VTQGRVEYESTISRGTGEGLDLWEARITKEKRDKRRGGAFQEDEHPVLACGGPRCIGMEGVLWRTSSILYCSDRHNNNNNNNNNYYYYYYYWDPLSRCSYQAMGWTIRS